jgi:hypothetical protein
MTAVSLVALCEVPGQEDKPDNSPRVLVLVDGRVVTGRITESPGGYFVEQVGGARVFQPYEVIRLTAVSLPEAYDKQRDALVRPTTGDHINLARWCFDNRLYEQANQQLAAALRLEPERSDARELLKQVAAAQQAGSTEPVEPGEPMESGRAASGLTPATTGEFTRRIQPLLVNKCANATCHGSASSNALRLVNVGRARRQQRLETEQNLSAALGQIDRARPDLSPLLRKPQDRESLVHRGVFFGPTGDGQIKMLQEWVREAAAESPEAVIADAIEETPEIELTSGEQSAAAGQSRQPPGAVSPLIIEIPRTPRANSQPAGRPEPRGDATEGDGAFLRRILDEERPDPFDPDEFNRQVHGRAGGANP